MGPFRLGLEILRLDSNRPLLDVLMNLPRERLLDSILAPDASFASRRAYARELARRRLEEAAYALRGAVGLPRGRRPLGQGHDFRHLTRQQVESLVYPDGSLAVDRVIFFERLDDGLAVLARDLSLPAATLPRLKVSRGTDDYRRHFDDEARALFARIYARDIAMWGYDFETGLPVAAQ